MTFRYAGPPTHPYTFPSSLVKRFVHVSRVLVPLMALAALVPVVRLGADWVTVSRVGLTVQPAGGGYDWVLWQEDDGVIRASYVHPDGTAAAAGIREGDIFFMLEYQQLFFIDALKGAVASIQPGSQRTYSVQRGGEIVEADVTFTRYPTFLYPLSGALWQFSIWGFTMGAFFHIVGLIVVGPLALRSSTARFSLLLILVSSLWIFSNLIRLMMLELFGPPVTPGDPYDRFFQALTFVGLVGWIGFPALLLHKVLRDAREGAGLSLGLLHYVIYLPAAVLGLAALLTTFRGHLGPITLDGLVAPILFYACCYIATASALMLLLRLVRASEAEELPGGWNLPGSALILVVSVLFALSVLGIVPLFGAVTDTMAAWLIVGAQLLSIAPVVMVSHVTLQHGKVDQVLSRALGYVVIFGLYFFMLVGGLSLLEPYLTRSQASYHVVAGLYALVLLGLFDYLARRTRGLAARLFTTDRHAMYQELSRFQEQLRTILDYETLAREAIHAIGHAFGARSAVVFLRPTEEAAPWITSTYHPEPPYLTERAVARVWPHFRREGRVWARNPELNESSLPPELHALLHARRAALIVPIQGDEAPIGLIALGPKRRMRSVYNLEEVDLLRSLSGQLALAVERLDLVEREKALIRRSAEAQLVALRAQINPHFLFNALNTIVALIAERPDEAEEAVEHLAAIFRHVLQTGSRPFVTLEEEFDLVGHYLSIEQMRFGEMLHVEYDVGADARSHPVPAFAVQTLVENAVKHGLARRRGGGTLRLRTSRVDGAVDVEVTDDGVGIPELFGRDPEAPLPQSFFGIGLRNVASRLEQLYGRDDLLRITSTPDAGTSVRLRLPLAVEVPRPHAERPHTSHAVAS